MNNKVCRISASNSGMYLNFRNSPCQGWYHQVGCNKDRTPGASNNIIGFCQPWNMGVQLQPTRLSDFSNLICCSLRIGLAYPRILLSFKKMQRNKYIKTNLWLLHVWLISSFFRTYQTYQCLSAVVLKRSPRKHLTNISPPKLKASELPIDLGCHIRSMQHCRWSLIK